MPALVCYKDSLWLVYYTFNTGFLNVLEMCLGFFSVTPRLELHHIICSSMCLLFSSVVVLAGKKEEVRQGNTYLCASWPREWAERRAGVGWSAQAPTTVWQEGFDPEKQSTESYRSSLFLLRVCLGSQPQLWHSEPHSNQVLRRVALSFLAEKPA